MRSYFLLAASLTFTLFACKTPKPVQYLGNVPFDTAKLSQVKIPEPRVQKGDILGIQIYSDNPEATAIFNQPVSAIGAGAASSAGSSQAGPSGYLVDYNGNIQFQTLGNLKVAGLTRAELSDTLKSKLSVFLINPYAVIKFLNYRVTVLGEVTKPGPISFQGDHLTVLQALGLAGDVTVYGLKDSILVIRESHGIREFANVDVSKPEVILSPYYYLEQNDMLIVKVNPKKPTVSAEVTARRIGLVTALVAILTSLTLIVSIFKQ